MSRSVGPVRLVVASANPDKVAEIEEILTLDLGAAIELVTRPPEIPEVDETGMTLEENARLKADALAVATGLGAIADDSGLFVDALGGAPGVHSARYAGELATYAANVERLLSELATVSERTARFQTVALAQLADGRILTCLGVVEGSIIDAPRGVGGFGYDPLFVPDEGDGRTFAEMTGVEKHAISARGRAFRALARRLRDELELPAR